MTVNSLLPRRFPNAPVFLLRGFRALLNSAPAPRYRSRYRTLNYLHIIVIGKCVKILLATTCTHHFTALRLNSIRFCVSVLSYLLYAVLMLLISNLNSIPRS